MDRFLRADPWGYRALFLALALLLLFLRLLPLGSRPGAFPGPDLLLCLTFAWMMRRPDYLPVGLIVAVTLVEDLVLMRPPGLWTALIVLATEFLRSRTALTRELNFVTEWLLAAGLMLGMLIAYRFVFALSFLPQPSFGHALVQILWSVLAYPVVVGLSRLSFDLKKPATGEIDDFGRRL
ncbi:rod shape-determining protein MreD [Rhodobacter sp. Har01]|uniref:rod shape-determining protein MreD n=1 Tax=Rhodobacter sp. Har01 TaxID=2883999 RepID=UPI001D0954FB|nr:rod shape-determining protein MreD [Rhodobacter sp. Har01]MCB6178434.1 rod shape-determining protein MreD [Rhodobacter sp. Har01]